MELVIHGVDPRALVTTKLPSPYPLPYISRRALARVKDRLDPPTACDCCGSVEVHLVSNDQIYNGKRYGDWPFAYLCLDCHAYVGLHPNTDLPLGTMADKDLRNKRKGAKDLWVSMLKDFGLEKDRAAAYAELAQALGIENRYCHFGMFDHEMCERVVQAVDKLYNDKVEKYLKGKK